MLCVARNIDSMKRFRFVCVFVRLVTWFSQHGEIRRIRRNYKSTIFNNRFLASERG